jgi:hypothetical protein
LTKRVFHSTNRAVRISLFSTVFACFAAGLAARAEEAPAFTSEVANQFAGWDRDHDGALTLSELDRAIANAEVRGAGAAAAVAVRQGMVRGKVERASLEEAQKLAGAEKTFTWGMKRLERAPRVLFAKDIAHPEGLRQGKLGDCFCLAGLRAVLERDPASAATMISVQPDGTYRVRIGATEVAVPPVTDGEILLGASVEDGLWPVVYEKAVGLVRTKASERETMTPFAVVTHGGSAGAMMAKLTAHGITRWSCQAWREAAAMPEKQTTLLEELRGRLQSAFAEKRLVTAGTNARPATGAVPGVTYSHGYTVLGYDATRDEVRLWNPHGDAFTPKGDPGLANGYPRIHGDWSAPLTEVVTFLAGFAFEKSGENSAPAETGVL